MKRFKVDGLCMPSKHYMADISGKIAQIKKLVDSGYYFTINRARQYGKTTILAALERALKGEYTVASISFQGLGDEFFETPANLCGVFMKHIANYLKLTYDDREYAGKWIDAGVINFDLLSDHITEMCCDRKFVLMIDEVDQASNNRVFLSFLGMLREKFLLRERDIACTFHSVILAGVYNIKNIKLKLINEGMYTLSSTESKIYNSPWNIAVDFDVDMSFSPAEIAAMLNEYESEHNTGMDITEIAREIYDYTSGYPFMVSRICQHIDEKLNQKWNQDGIEEAVQMLLTEQNTLFDDLFKNIRNNENLRELLCSILFAGNDLPFNIDDEIISMGYMYGFLKNVGGKTRVANRIFEMRIYNYFILQEIKAADYSVLSAKATVIQGGRLDMALCLEKFQQHYAEITSGKDLKFLERHGTLLFLSYLKPLINGEGDYYVEPQISDFRMDIVVQFRSQRFILEVKLWHGGKRHDEAYGQLYGYLAKKKMSEGYLLTFNFNKGENKERKAEWVEYNGKKIFDVIV